jgi:Tfp pilus assembly protein FimT
MERSQMKDSESMPGTTLLEVLIVFAIVSIMLGWTLPDPTPNLNRYNVKTSNNIAASNQEALSYPIETRGSASVQTGLDQEPVQLPTKTDESEVTGILQADHCENRNAHLEADESGVIPACPN